MPLRTKNPSASATMNDLPAELLVEIIRQLHRDCSLSPPWFHTTFVCRRWRAVILGYAPFWTRIETTNLEKARAYLERSNVSPIDLSIADFPPEEDQRQILTSLLSPHLHRVEFLRMKAQHAEEVFQVQYLGSSFPILELLHILSSYDNLVNEVNLPLDAPCIRYLQVNGTTLNWQSTLYKNLESLTLSFAFGVPPTMHQFLGVLEACPSLSSLDIDGFMLDAPVPQECQSVRLLHLEHCHIGGRQHDVATLLQHLDFPSCDLFAIEFMPRNWAQASRNMWVLPEDIDSRFPFIRQYPNAQIISENPFLTDERYPVTITLTPEDSSTPLFTVSLPDVRERLRPIVFDSVTAFLQSFAITILRVEYDLTFISRTMWLAALLNLPQLESLLVIPRTDDDSESLSAADLYMALYAESPTGQVVCPKLEELRLLSVKFNPTLVGLLHSTLKVRALLGSKLEELSIDDWSTMGTDKPVWSGFGDVADKFMVSERPPDFI